MAAQEGLRSARIEAALEQAVTGGGMVALFDQLSRGSGLPGPRPNFELARAAGTAIAGYGVRADGVLRALLGAEDEYPKIVAAEALAARKLAGVDPKGAMEGLQSLVDDGRHLVRMGVVDALRVLLNARGDAIVTELSAWTDGYLQAHAALWALADRTLLASLKAGGEVLARLDEAFSFADLSPRAAERSQGLRELRKDLPAQIALIAARFPEALDWVLARTESKRPETREVVAHAIAALRKSSLSHADTDRLTSSLQKAAPAPRDPSRIVQGTRKRGKGRRRGPV